MIDGVDTLRRLVLNGLGYSGVCRLARPLVGSVGAILMLHRVTAHPRKPCGVNRHLNIAPAFLDALIADMKAVGFEFVSLDEALGAPGSGQGRPALCHDHRRRRLSRQSHRGAAGAGETRCAHHHLCCARPDRWRGGSVVGGGGGHRQRARDVGAGHRKRFADARIARLRPGASKPMRGCSTISPSRFARRTSAPCSANWPSPTVSTRRRRAARC